jgi:hypothetical protein
MAQSSAEVTDVSAIKPSPIVAWRRYSDAGSDGDALVLTKNGPAFDIAQALHHLRMADDIGKQHRAQHAAIVHSVDILGCELHTDHATKPSVDARGAEVQHGAVVRHATKLHACGLDRNKTKWRHDGRVRPEVDDGAIDPPQVWS